MTNQLTNALVKAGFPSMPVTKRIWLWLKDHPDHTADEIATALQFKKSSTYVALLDLTSRGMVSRRKVKRRSALRGFSTNGTFEYAAIGAEYELLPVRKSFQAEKTGLKAVKPGAEPAQVTAKVANESSEAPRQEPETITTSHPIPPAKDGGHGIDINAIPLREAFKLWSDLCVYFGDQRAVA